MILRKENIAAKELSQTCIIPWDQQNLLQSYFISLFELVFGSIQR